MMVVLLEEKGRERREMNPLFGGSFFLFLTCFFLWYEIVWIWVYKWKRKNVFLGEKKSNIVLIQKKQNVEKVCIAKHLSALSIERVYQQRDQIACSLKKKKTGKKRVKQKRGRYLWSIYLSHIYLFFFFFFLLVGAKFHFGLAFSFIGEGEKKMNEQKRNHLCCGMEKRQNGNPFLFCFSPGK